MLAKMREAGVKWLQASTICGYAHLPPLGFVTRRNSNRQSVNHANTKVADPLSFVFERSP